MLKAAHLLIVGLYLAAPVVALAVAVFRRRMFAWATTTLAGTIIGAALCLVYAAAVGGALPVTQVIFAAYFAAALLFLLKGFDALLTQGLRRAMRVRADSAPGGWRSTTAAALRVVILFGIGLPYVMASVMTYRPKVAPVSDPKSEFGYTFERVSFRATDGTKLIGWWIPAWRGPADDTVLICHGLGADKSNLLMLAQWFVPNGYNVLIFDLRAHGESGGQLSGLGALEGRDVLGAVRWLREDHPDESRRIFGLGASMGGAALVQAATDGGEDGQAIDALAVLGTYDGVDPLARTIARRYFIWPLDWLLIHLGVPLASAQVGADLRGFDVAAHLRDLWPRPILVVHGMQDQIIAFQHGRALFDAASPPRQHLWLPRATHNDIFNDDRTAHTVREFFRHADRLPAI